MTSQDTNAIVDAISKHINRQGGPRSSWYIGITSDIRERLHGDHRVPEKDHWYIWRETYSSSDSRAIEKAFLNWGCDGGGGGGDRTSKYVYAYLKSAITAP